MGIRKAPRTMKRSYASQSPRTRKKDTIEVNGYSSEEPEEEDPEELEEDSELDPEEDSVEEVEEDPEDLIEVPDEDPSEEYASQPSSESDADETDHNSSNDRKRSGDATEFGSTPFQVNQPQKKTRYEDVQSKSGNQRRSRWDPQPEQEGGSSGKRRRSRWDSHPEQDGETGGGDASSSKRRKTRWASEDDSKLKLLGPLQLSDFKKDVWSQFDPEVRVLHARVFEINNKLQRSELHDERPEGERSPSPQPICNNLGIRINTREVRMRSKLMEERQLIISKIINKNVAVDIPTETVPKKLSKKVYIPVKEYPDYNFIGLIIGPRGNTQKRLEKETGATIKLRGKGSVRKPRKPDPTDDDDLHVYIESGDRSSLDKAVAMVEKLLIPFPLENNEHKRAQLEELARLEATCNLCKEKGHKAYACPQRPSGLNAIQKPNKKETDEAKLYIGYLPHSVNDNRLRELFSPFGKIISACVIVDRTTGSSKGFGFVNFESPVEAAGAVMHMNGYQMNGNKLAVRVAGRPSGTGSTAPSPSFPCVGVPRPLLPGAQQSFPNSPPAFMFPISSSHLPHFRAPQFPGDPDYRGSFPSSAAQFPGDPDYVGSSPSLIAQFPGDPDYPGSKFKQYFTSPTLGPSQPMNFNHSPSQFPR